MLPSRSRRAACAALLTCLVAAGLAGCGRRGPLEPPEGSASAAVPKTVSELPPAVATPSAGLATEPLGPAYQTGVPNQTVLPGTGRSSFPLDPLL
ncbi:MAG TPA: lipoprotein [Beijerinckiaceae bacterium]|nr:lipoprotein [Beijerinckiaceae bacterium]